MPDFLVLLIGLPLLWVWWRHHQRRTRLTEEQLEEQSAATWRTIRDDVDQLIDLEIASLPPDEQQRWTTQGLRGENRVAAAVRAGRLAGKIRRDGSGRRR